MTYKIDPYERNSAIGDMEFSLLEMLFKDNKLFADFKIDPSIITHNRTRAILQFAESKSKFDTEEIVTESKVNNNFVPYEFIENMIKRDNDYVYNFVRYQNQLLQNFKHYKLNELLKQNNNINDLNEVDSIIKSLDYYSNLNIETKNRKQEIVDETLEDLYSEEVNDNYIKTGYKKLDMLMKGFEEKTLNIIAANPSVGKSALGINLLWNIAKADNEVSYFSLEMNGKQIAHRLSSIITKIDTNKIRDKNLSGEEIDYINRVLTTIRNNAKVKISDDANCDVRDIRQEAMKKVGDKPKVIIIDHMMLMNGTVKNQDVRLKLADISRELKIIAKETGTVIIALAQLSRGNTKREDKRPKISDIQESGNIEQNADNIILIHRDDYHDQDSDNDDLSPTQLILAKNREGSKGVVDVNYYKNIQKFYDA